MEEVIYQEANFYQDSLTRLLVDGVHTEQRFQVLSPPLMRSTASAGGLLTKVEYNLNEGNRGLILRIPMNSQMSKYEKKQLSQHHRQEGESDTGVSFKEWCRFDDSSYLHDFQIHPSPGFSLSAMEGSAALGSSSTSIMHFPI
ncbi:MAG: hypothetical protein WA705_26800 [Candidatus Ozemobacteraceae bacterium]